MARDIRGQGQAAMAPMPDKGLDQRADWNPAPRASGATKAFIGAEWNSDSSKRYEHHVVMDIVSWFENNAYALLVVHVWAQTDKIDVSSGGRDNRWESEKIIMNLKLEKKP
jgi:hypothetical protein